MLDGGPLGVGGSPWPPWPGGLGATGAGGELVTGVPGDDTLTPGPDTPTFVPDTPTPGVETSTPGTDTLTLGTDASIDGALGVETIGVDTVTSGAPGSETPSGCAPAPPAAASATTPASSAPPVRAARVEHGAAIVSHRVSPAAARSCASLERRTVVAPLPTHTWTASVKRVISAKPLPLSARAVVFGADPANVP